MSNLRLVISMSVDGYVAGPDQSVEQPLGVGGEQLHEWVIPLEAFRRMHGRDGGEVNASTPIVEASRANVGATIMGRNMFGGHPGPWADGADAWNGWWGEDPPFGHPVFVLTHHAREPLQLGATTFTFVTDGIDSALAQAREAASGQDIVLAGGASACRQYLTAGLVDTMYLSVAPVLLGSGERLFDDLGEPLLAFRLAEHVAAPGVTHYRFERAS